MSTAETIQAAIEKLKELQKERGVENGWLYEVDPDIKWPEDPRVPLVNGGPDVMLQRTVEPQLAILREVLKAADIEAHWETLVYTETALDLANAILKEEA